MSSNDTAAKRRRWPKITLSVATAIVVALAINAVAQDHHSVAAKTDIGHTVSTPQGDIQVRSEGKGPALVLIHGYSASMHWWSRVVPKLRKHHRAIRIDLLGHGGSEKPTSGYSIQNQADAVIAVLKKLGVRRFDLAGHSMGGYVAASIAEHHSRQVGKVVVIGSGAEPGDGKLPLTGRLLYVPVIGQLMETVAFPAAVRGALKSAFAPNYKGDIPNQFVQDYLRCNYSALSESHDAITQFVEAKTNPERLRTAGLPLLVISGRQDQIVNPKALLKYRTGVPNARTVYLNDTGHTPMHERPKSTARLIERFLAAR